MLRVNVNVAAANSAGGGGGGGGGGTGSGGGGGGSTGMMPDLVSPSVGSGHGLHRRESFLYRTDVLDGELSPTRARLTSRCDSTSSEDIIVTPVAQMIDSMRKVVCNWSLLFPSSREPSTSDYFEANFSFFAQLPDERRQIIAMETLQELRWCLDQLESMQTDRSAAQIATSKFKRMLNRELFNFVESDKCLSQVTQFISRTFIDEIQVEEEKKTEDPGRKVDDPMTLMTLSRDIHRQPETGGLLTLKDSGKVLVRRNCTTYYHSDIPADEVPTYGVQTSDEAALAQHMSNLNTWGMNMFDLAQVTANRPLTAVTFTILKERRLLETFRIPSDILLNFLTNLENHYKSDIPYHNSLHAADVAQSSHVLLSLPAFTNVFSDLEILATIFAAAVHDVDHPGFNNQFLINSNSELALLYNDESVLENHHLAVAFQLLQQEKCDIFVNISKKQRQTLRHLVIEMVLATDMSKHVRHLAHLKSMVELGRLSGNNRTEVENSGHKQQILQSLVHCADLSNPTKPWDIYKQWTDKVMEEFFRQGDREKQLQLDVSPMCDRDTARVASSQVGFIDFVVRPLWETWADLVFPDCQQILDTMEENRQRHKQLMEEEFPPHEITSSQHNNASQHQDGCTSAECKTQTHPCSPF